MTRMTKTQTAKTNAPNNDATGKDTTGKVTTSPASAELFIPLNRLKKSPRNARKMAHGQDAVEALAASIHAKGMLQNLVVEPEVNEGKPTGCYLVTIGEGRRLAQLLRVARKQIRKTEPIRCRLDTANDAAEISLDENVTRTGMHPADQFDAFRDLAERRGLGAEDIAARFGVSAQTVRQRLRLSAVAPRLMQFYRDGDLTLEQMMAFAITEDHARQEQVHENLTHDDSPRAIRRELTRGSVPAHDRRVRLVGADAYREAGGVIVRDLFTEDGGGFFENAALLDRLVLERLQSVAAQVQAEGWKWAEAHIDYPHAHGLRRCYPEQVALSGEDEARLTAASEQYDRLAAGYDDYDDMTPEDAATLTALEAEVEALMEKRSAYVDEVKAQGGVFVVLGHDGQPRIERGFVRREDESRVAPDEDAGYEGGCNRSAVRDDGASPLGAGDTTLPDALIRDLTAHRTLALRLALGEQPDMALVALTHALAAQCFDHDGASCLEIRASSAALGGYASGIADSSAARALEERHEAWAKQLPRKAAGLWAFVAAMDGESRAMLLAHCVALSINAVRLLVGGRAAALKAADDLARAVRLDMTRHWTPTVQSYFGRVTKAAILDAVRDAVSSEAAERIAPMKKGDMADAAERLLAGAGWLPELLRLPALASDAEGSAEDAAADAGSAFEDDDRQYLVAAE